MVSEKSGKTYHSYVSTYEKWCRNNQHPQESSLDSYEHYLKYKQKSNGYIRNCIGAIARLKCIPLAGTRSVKRNTLTDEERFRLKNFCRRTFKTNELSLLLVLVLEMGLKTALALTTSDVENAIVDRRLPNERYVSDQILPVFEYVLSVSYQKKPKDSVFSKKYHSYLHAFKRRQHNLFPNMPHVSFNGLKK